MFKSFLYDLVRRFVCRCGNRIGYGLKSRHNAKQAAIFYLQNGHVVLSQLPPCFGQQIFSIGVILNTP
ncbi:hypothetical protein PUNNY_50 [Escherichia phage_vB_EcoD_Punny]|nr:hypothetical protein PUNNY_50 [Escherichia phage_vB_EcoD_Punny]UGO53860.1 hypothetical protein REINASAURUS_48 [Citrobacter phage vB_CfrD_Reinasaurus]